jgi:hypothetical protein
LAAVVLSGCTPDAKPKPGADNKDDKVQGNLALLGDADAKAAAEQKYCAIETDNRLGLMGAPLKVMAKGEPVFVCCSHCVKKVEDNPDKALATAKELKAKAAKEAAQK